MSRFYCLATIIATVLFLSACVTNDTGRVGNIDNKKAHDAHLNLGLSYLKSDNREASRHHFEKALKLKPNSAAAHNGLALLYQLTGEVGLAEKSFGRALKDASYTQARLSYGSFLYQQARYADAANMFERATKDLSFPQRALALSYFGQSQLQLGQRDKAKSLFDHAANIANKLALPRIELAKLYFEDKDYAKSKQYLDEYTALAGRTAKSLWLGIRIERIFGNKDKEASYALALKNLHPYSSEYLEYKQALRNEK